MVSVKIRGMEFAVPKTSFNNDDMARIVETSDEWIVQRTGIKTRYIANESENAVTLGIEAVQKLFKNENIDPKSIDLIISATSAPERPYPSVGCEIQNAFDIEKAPAFDLVAACSGFLYALQMARANILSGLYKRILVIASDTTTKFLDWKDRASCVLFGDGASATLVEAVDNKENDIKVINIYADGKNKELISLNVENSICPLHGKNEKEINKHIFMNGREVYKYVMRKIPAAIKETLESVNMTINDIDFFIPHQANLRMIEALSERIGIDSSKVLNNIEKYGNMSATSIPCVISEYRKKGVIKPNSTLLLSAFGAGMTYAVGIVRAK